MTLGLVRELAAEGRARFTRFRRLMKCGKLDPKSRRKLTSQYHMLSFLTKRIAEFYAVKHQLDASMLSSSSVCSTSIPIGFVFHHHSVRVPAPPPGSAESRAWKPSAARLQAEARIAQLKAAYAKGKNLARIDAARVIPDASAYRKRMTALEVELRTALAAETREEAASKLTSAGCLPVPDLLLHFLGPMSQKSARDAECEAVLMLEGVVMHARASTRVATFAFILGVGDVLRLPPCALAVEQTIERAREMLHIDPPVRLGDPPRPKWYSASTAKFRPDAADLVLTLLTECCDEARPRATTSNAPSHNANMGVAPYVSGSLETLSVNSCVAHLRALEWSNAVWRLDANVPSLGGGAKRRAALLVSAPWPDDRRNVLRRTLDLLSSVPTSRDGNADVPIDSFIAAALFAWAAEAGAQDDALAAADSAFTAARGASVAAATAARRAAEAVRVAGTRCLQDVPPLRRAEREAIRNLVVTHDRQRPAAAHRESRVRTSCGTDQAGASGVRERARAASAACARDRSRVAPRLEWRALLEGDARDDEMLRGLDEQQERQRKEWQRVRAEAVAEQQERGGSSIEEDEERIRQAQRRQAERECEWETIEAQQEQQRKQIIARERLRRNVMKPFEWAGTVSSRGDENRPGTSSDVTGWLKETRQKQQDRLHSRERQWRRQQERQENHLSGDATSPGRAQYVYRTAVELEEWERKERKAQATARARRWDWRLWRWGVDWEWGALQLCEDDEHQEDNIGDGGSVYGEGSDDASEGDIDKSTSSGVRAGALGRCAEYEGVTDDSDADTDIGSDDGSADGGDPEGLSRSGGNDRHVLAMPTTAVLHSDAKPAFRGQEPASQELAQKQVHEAYVSAVEDRKKREMLENRRGGNVGHGSPHTRAAVTAAVWGVRTAQAPREIDVAALWNDSKWGRRQYPGDAGQGIVKKPALTRPRTRPSTAGAPARPASVQKSTQGRKQAREQEGGLVRKPDHKHQAIQKHSRRRQRPTSALTDIRKRSAATAQHLRQLHEHGRMIETGRTEVGALAQFHAGLGTSSPAGRARARRGKMTQQTQKLVRGGRA